MGLKDVHISHNSTYILGLEYLIVRMMAGVKSVGTKYVYYGIGVFVMMAEVVGIRYYLHTDCRLQLPETESLKLEWIGSSLNSYHLGAMYVMYI